MTTTEHRSGVEVVTLGEAMVALITSDTAPLHSAEHFARTVVGAESNVAIGLSRLGHRTAFYGCTGTDVHGGVVLRALRAENVDVRGVRRIDDRATGLLIRDAALAQPITVAYYRDQSAGTQLRPEDVNVDELSTAKVLHITGITAALSESARAAVEFAANSARAAGVTVTLDPNIRLRLASAQRWRELIDSLARLADVVLIGGDELDLLSADQSPRWFLDRGASRVVIKNGAAGATETDGTTIQSTAARPVPVVDPVGAGDAFAAGWISSWLDQLPPAERLRRAAAVAACVVATRTDTAGLPDAVTLGHLLDGAQDVNR